MLQEFINLYHTYCPDELVYTPEELKLMESYIEISKTHTDSSEVSSSASVSI